MLVRRLLLREGRRSRSLRLRVCRGCSVECIRGRQAWGISVPTLFVSCLPAPFYSLPSLSLPLAGQPTASSSTYQHHHQQGSQTYHTPNLLWDTSTNDNASRPLFIYIYHPSMHIPFPSSPFPLPSFQTPFSSPAHASSTLALQFLYDPSAYLNSNVIPSTTYISNLDGSFHPISTLFHLQLFFFRFLDTPLQQSNFGTLCRYATTRTRQFTYLL